MRYGRRYHLQCRLDPVTGNKTVRILTDYNDKLHAIFDEALKGGCRSTTVTVEYAGQLAEEKAKFLARCNDFSPLRKDLQS